MKDSQRIYTVRIAGQFEFRTDVEAESEEEAKKLAEEEMETEVQDVDVTAINSVRVVPFK